MHYFFFHFLLRGQRNYLLVGTSLPLLVSPYLLLKQLESGLLAGSIYVFFYPCQQLITHQVFLKLMLNSIKQP